MNLREIFFSNKSIDVVPRWITDGSDTYSFSAPLSVDSVTFEGLVLRGKALARHLDRAFVLQIELRPLSGWTNMPLARAEWRPLKTHNNGGNGPENLRFVDQKCSHLHDFSQNYIAIENRMRVGLKIALPIIPDPSNVRDFIDIVGKSFRINNMMNVPEPPAQGSLF